MGILQEMGKNAAKAIDEYNAKQKAKIEEKKKS